MKIIDAEPVMRRIRAALEICEEVRTNGRDELEAVLDDLESQPALSTNLAEVGTDLISRAEAIDALKRKQDDGKGDLSRFYNTIIQHDIEAIMQLPPIQPEIVRCKDCKYWHSGSCEYPEHVVNSQDYYVGDIETEAEHFCGYAERREVNHESN